MRVFVDLRPFDMRGHFRSMAGRVRGFGLEPADGHVFLFVSRNRKMAAVFLFDGSGWCQYRKRLEVYHDHETIVFHFEPDKEGETQARKLTGFHDVLLVDGESRYNQTAALPGIIEANCHAHPRRKLLDAEQMQPVLAKEGGRFIQAFFEQEAKAREAALNGEELVAWRRRHQKPILEEFRSWSAAVYPTLLPDDPLAKVIRYYRNHWAELTVCLDHPVPIDNSGSERLFQPIAKLRLNSLFAGGMEGGHRAAILLGIAATCRRLNVDLEAYLSWVFIRRGTHKNKYNLSAAEMTPAAYKRAIATT